MFDPIEKIVATIFLVAVGALLLKHSINAEFWANLICMLFVAFIIIFLKYLWHDDSKFRSRG